MTELLQKLGRDHRLTTVEYTRLLQLRDPKMAMLLRRMADRTRRKHWESTVHLRGVLDVSTICQHECPHCTQRSSADPRIRYRLRPREILDLCEEAAGLEISNIVLRCGNDRFYGDEMLCGILEKLGRSFPKMNVTIAMGERSRRSYERLYNAGAKGYILLQETADRERYEQLHGEDLSYDRRMHCLNEIRDTGFHTTCGFVVGDPGQSDEDLARELKFLEEFQPDGVELVMLARDEHLQQILVGLIRLILPNALVTAPENGIDAALYGANLVSTRLFGPGRTHPVCGGNPAGPLAGAEALAALRQSLADVGFEITMDPLPWEG